MTTTGMTTAMVRVLPALDKPPELLELLVPSPASAAGFELVAAACPPVCCRVFPVVRVTTMTDGGSVCPLEFVRAGTVVTCVITFVDGGSDDAVLTDVLVFVDGGSTVRVLVEVDDVDTDVDVEVDEEEVEEVSWLEVDELMGVDDEAGVLLGLELLIVA